MTGTERPELGRTGDDDRVQSREAVNERLRAAFVEGAEEESLRSRGRGLTEAELRAILADDPGDL